jgi:NAD(P)-dependent dehydrogenase (short-subunit alcohol dehydrogenase family)
MNIFISGVSRGLGEGLARIYAERGESVFGISRATPATRIAGVSYGAIDLVAPAASRQLSRFMSAVPHVDVIINNAGTGSTGCRLAEVDAAEVMSQFHLHCAAPLAVAQTLLGKLNAARQPKIINITSRLGSVLQHRRGDFDGLEFSYPYRIAKAAQNMLSLCMASDPSLKHVLVASVNPGLLRTGSGSSDACFSAEEGALRVARLIDDIIEPGLYHAFGGEALY